MIDVSDLSIEFKRGGTVVRAVRGLGFHVNAGESFGIVGESGSGKSTVLRALVGLNQDWRGRIEIDGIAQQPVRPRTFYKLVQMVFQDPYGSLHPRHTIYRTLSDPIAVHALGDQSGRIERILKNVGLPASFRYRFPHQLSGGQRQRVAIARALVLEPRILLLDEPTSALDVSVQAEVLNLLTRLRRELGLTYVLVSHNLAVISHMCDRIAVMKSGQLVEEMPVDRLRDGRVGHPYTKELMISSRGYIDRTETVQGILR